MGRSGLSQLERPKGAHPLLAQEVGLDLLLSRRLPLWPAQTCANSDSCFVENGSLHKRKFPCGPRYVDSAWCPQLDSNQRTRACVTSSYELGALTSTRYGHFLLPRSEGSCCLAAPEVSRHDGRSSPLVRHRPCSTRIGVVMHPRRRTLRAPCLSASRRRPWPPRHALASRRLVWRAFFPVWRRGPHTSLGNCPCVVARRCAVSARARRVRVERAGSPAVDASEMCKRKEVMRAT